MATVYQAVQESLERPVALKILKDTDEPSFSQRFLAEGKTIAALRHPNIITIYDIGIVDDIHFISMELIEGGDLDDRIESGIKPKEAVDILRKLAGCLSYVHSKDVVHRDIKPGNILFREDGEPLLTDFGIAKQLGAKNKLTLDGIALGSPFYLSPEQSQCKKLDGRADIYSLGIVFYEMLTGRRPFEGKAPIDTILMHLQEPLPKLKKSLQLYQPLLDKMTDKAAKNRYRNCDALIKAIDKLGEADGPAVKRKKAETKKAADEDLNRYQTVTGFYGQGQTQTMTQQAPQHKTAPMAKPQKDPFSRMRLWAIFIMLTVVFLWSGMPLWLLGKMGLYSPPVEHSDSPIAFDWKNSQFSPAKNSDTKADQTTRENPSIADYLRLARTRLVNNRLTLPADDNAWLYYKKALSIDPKHPEALKGLDAIADRYVKLAREALGKNNSLRAKKYLKRSLQVSPQHTASRQLLAELEPQNKTASQKGSEPGWFDGATTWLKGWFD